MKKNNKTYIVLTSLLVSLFISPSLTQAATNGTPPKTKGTVIFEPADGNNSVIIPDTKPPVVAETDGVTTVPGGVGQVMITAASQFNFGTQKLSPAAMTYEAQSVALTSNSQTRQIAPFIQISDTSGRDGAAAFWQLKVSASEFVGQADGKILKGANIKIGKNKVFNSDLANAQETSGQVENDPLKISYKDNFELTSTSQALMTAKNGQGNALTTLIFDSEYTGNKVYPVDLPVSTAQLIIPTATVKTAQSYQSEIIWELSVTPEG